MKRKRWIVGLTSALLATVLFAGVALAATTIVSPANLQGWGFIQETATGSGALVAGPATPPLGSGSANLIVDGTGGEIIAKAGYQGLKLADITTLQYSTYRTSGAPALAITLQFNIDHDDTDAQTGFQGRLVYEPYHTQAVSAGVWQTWNALNDSAGTGTGNWWFTPGGGYRPGVGVCPQSNPCTWAQVLAAFPNAAIHQTQGAVVLKAGGGWAGGFNGNVDALTINGDTYNFEVINVAQTKDDCKNGGWQNVTDGDGNPFKNQGDCIQYVNTGK